MENELIEQQEMIAQIREIMNNARQNVEVFGVLDIDSFSLPVSRKKIKVGWNDSRKSWNNA